jgi:CubicO group peptidase (beta-lactamase class C family)
MKGKIKMNKMIIATLIFLFFITPIKSQNLRSIADSIRMSYNIPEIAYAIVSSDSILEMNYLGVKRANSTIQAEPTDRFHIGSNTKAITGLIAALLVKQNKISWDTKFFDLFPQLKSKCNPAYYDITLVDLLSHRAKIRPLTDGEEFPNPIVGKFKGGIPSQRRQFAEWVLTLEPIQSEEPFSYSNAGYSIAAVMLEKVSGKTWENLVLDLGNILGLEFGFSWPNISDSTQPWGHWGSDNVLIPTPPDDYYRLFWVEPAGDINMKVKDYARFIQLQLLGLQGRSDLMRKEEFEFIHYGIPDHYSIGWSWGVNDKGQHISSHDGSAETFYCRAYIIHELDRAYILFANCGSEQAQNGVTELLRKMIKKY